MTTPKIRKHHLEALYVSHNMNSLVEILKDISMHDAEELSKNISITRSCEEIALHVAEMRGRQRMLERIINIDSLLDFLDGYIVEEKPIEVTHE